MKVLLDIDEEYYNQVVMSNTKVGEFLRKGRPINDHVTVTNGDIFKTLYPNLEIIEEDDDYSYFQIYCDGFSPTYIPIGAHKDWLKETYWDNKKKNDDRWHNEWLDEVSKDETT